VKTPLHRPALSGALALALVNVALAARPLVTDDTGVLERGDCELEAVLARDKADGVRVDGQGLQLGCGVGGQVQLSLGVDSAKSEGVRVRGSTLSGKVALLPGDDASWSASAAVQWASPSGEGTRHVANAVTMLHTRTLNESFTLHANLGHARDAEASRSATVWGVALEHVGWGPVALMGELYGDDLAAPLWNLGLRWNVIPDRLVLDIAYGRQIVGGQPWALSTGLKLAF
jgi:hypothetical protein